MLFKELEGLLSSRKFCTVADSMQALADAGELRYVEVAELACNAAWFGHETMQTALMAYSRTRRTDDPSQPASPPQLSMHSWHASPTAPIGSP